MALSLGGAGLGVSIFLCFCAFGLAMVEYWEVEWKGRSGGLLGIVEHRSVVASADYDSSVARVGCGSVKNWREIEICREGI